MLQPIVRGDNRSGVSPTTGIAEYRQPQTIVMIFFGEYDLAVRDQLRADLARLADAPKVVLDLSEVTYLDAGTIAEFVRLHNVREAKHLERETIVLKKPYWLKIFGLLHLREAFRITETLEDAIRQSGELVDLDCTYCVARRTS